MRDVGEEGDGGVVEGVAEALLFGAGGVFVGALRVEEGTACSQTSITLDQCQYLLLTKTPLILTHLHQRVEESRIRCEITPLKNDHPIIPLRHIVLFVALAALFAPRL